MFLDEIRERRRSVGRVRGSKTLGKRIEDPGTCLGKIIVIAGDNDQVVNKRCGGDQFI
jgi:hypothetical protein